MSPFLPCEDVGAVVPLKIVGAVPMLVAIETFAEPSNDTEPVTAPVKAIVLAVANLLAVRALPATEDVITLLSVNEDTPGALVLYSPITKSWIVPLLFKLSDLIDGTANNLTILLLLNVVLYLNTI